MFNGLLKKFLPISIQSQPQAQKLPTIMGQKFVARKLPFSLYMFEKES